ncbi:MAG: hypothetical protein GF365_03980 [Candidatus Buchananbacteria bacterium]|nr:hypothetical protein [Candidatus Buchananbacteria bacterium]
MRKNLKILLIVLIVLMITYAFWQLVQKPDNQDLYAKITEAVVIAIMVLGGLYALLIAPKKETKRIAKLKSQGLKIETDFIKIEGRNYNSHKGKYNYYVIKTKGIDPQSHKPKEYLSKYIYKKPADKEIPNIINVYVDPQESKNYFMDLPFLNNN